MLTVTNITRSDSTDNGFNNAHAWANSILEMVERLEAATDDTREDVEREIHESALSVEVRTDWRAVGSNDTKPTHYRILLSYGGPSLHLTGDLDEYGQPVTARLEYQDWGTPWTVYYGHSYMGNEFRDALLAFASTFYFGE